MGKRNKKNSPLTVIQRTNNYKKKHLISSPSSLEAQAKKKNIHIHAYIHTM